MNEETKFNVNTFDVAKYDAILAKGLSHGLGDPASQVCIEAAICQVLGLKHGDDPRCVTGSVRRFKIRLNDSRWSSPEARAKGLHDLGLAQLGSLGVVDDLEFSKRMAEKTIRIIIPKLFRSIFPNNAACLETAQMCEIEGTRKAARKASAAAYAVSNAAYADAYAAAADAAAAAAYAADAADDAAFAGAAAAAGVSNAADDAAAGAGAAAAYAAAAAAYAAYAAAAAADFGGAAADTYLNLSAQLALETLRELKSPGVTLLQGGPHEGA